MLRRAFLAIIRTLGSPVHDCETGEPLGRALIFAWRGRVHVWGIERPVEPCVLAEGRLSYWRHRIGFRAARRPDASDETLR